jgi:hypothetical protein
VTRQLSILTEDVGIDQGSLLKYLTYFLYFHKLKTTEILYKHKNQSQIAKLVEIQVKLENIQIFNNSKQTIFEDNFLEDDMNQDRNPKDFVAKEKMDSDDTDSEEETDSEDLANRGARIGHNLQFDVRQFFNFLRAQIT